MMYLIALIAMAVTYPQTGDIPLKFEQLGDRGGVLLFSLPGTGYHDVVVTGADGEALAVKKIGDNAWTAAAAPSGTFSVILCSETNCTPLDYTWFVEGYVAPPAGPCFAWAVTLVCGALMTLIVLGILYQYWLIADEKATARQLAGLKDACAKTLFKSEPY